MPRDHANPADGAFFVGDDEAERAFFVIARGAVATIGQQHDFVGGGRIDFADGEHHAIAVVRFEQHVIRHARACEDPCRARRRSV